MDDILNLQIFTELKFTIIYSVQHCLGAQFCLPTSRQIAQLQVQHWMITFYKYYKT